VNAAPRSCTAAPRRGLAGSCLVALAISSAVAAAAPPEPKPAPGPPTEQAEEPAPQARAEQADTEVGFEAEGETDIGAESGRSAFSDGKTTIALPDEHTRRGFAALDQPTTMAEFGFGWITLPGATVCVERLQAGCKSGDTSLMIDGWLLYRNNTRIAFGAGMTLGFLTTTTAPRQDPPGVNRDHRRGYFNFEGIVRYYPYVGESFEMWTGATAGLIVVSDQFASENQFGDAALVGPRGVTIRTEGLALGLGVGGVLALAGNWSLGGSLRYGAWLLPATPAQDPLNDTASLSGANMFLSIGVGIGYRIAL
jgi:hypothetical protein